MNILRTVRAWTSILRDPRQAFEQLPRRRFESVLVEYLGLLVGTGLLAGSYVFLQSLTKGLVYAVFLDVTIDWWRLTNYAMGGVSATLTFYVFAGTFVLLLLSWLAQPFCGGVNYFDLLACLIYALAPVLLFGWIVWLAPALLVWSLFLLVTGLPVLRRARGRIKGTIEQRE